MAEENQQATSTAALVKQQDSQSKRPVLALWREWCEGCTVSDDERILHQVPHTNKYLVCPPRNESSWRLVLCPPNTHRPRRTANAASSLQVVASLLEPETGDDAAMAMAYMLTSALRRSNGSHDRRAQSSGADDRLCTLLASLGSLPTTAAERIITRLHPQEALALPPPLPGIALDLAITNGCFDASLFLMRTTPCGRPIPGPSPLLALAPPTTLTSLRLSPGALGTAFGGPAVPWLISSLRGSPALTLIDIGGLPHFTATAAAAMVRAAPNLLHLRIRSFHLFNGFGALSKALANLTALSHLDLSCSPPSAIPNDAPPAATVKFSSFASLSTKTALSHVTLRMMPDRHLSALIPSLPFASLVHLDITGAYKDSGPATDSLAALLPHLPTATGLSTLLIDGHCALRWTGIPPLCDTISNLPALRNLALCAAHDVPYLDGPLHSISRFTALSLDSLDVVSLRQLLARSRCINTLRLFNCGHRIQQEAECVTRNWETLQQALVSPLQSLRKVSLEILALGVSGHRGVLALLEQLTQLEDVTWSNSLAGSTQEVVTEFAPLYGGVMGALPQLTRLEVREQSVEASLPLLSAIAPRLPALTSLRELWLQACEPMQQTASEEQSSVRSHGADDCAEALMLQVARLTALETLQLAHMAWSAPLAARAITAALSSLRSLRWLSLRGTPIGRPGAEPLAAALHELPLLDHLDLRGTCIGMAGSDSVWLKVLHLPLRSGVLFWGE